jgi:hypothetical protein
MPELCVVHLARHANGWEPFDRFMRSYEEHPAAIDHDLVVGVKGCPASGPPPAYLERVAPSGGRVLPLEDTGFDIGSYWATARALPYASYCFLNSFSVILDDGWLAKMARHHVPSVGLVGASGSWEAHLSEWTRNLRAGLLLLPWRTAPEPLPPRRLTARDKAWLVKDWLRHWTEFPPFPNPHIRTNAFLIRRDLMLDIEVGDMSNKADVLRFESGRQSLTRQIRRRDLDVLVVGQDGVGYRPDAWPQSHTFRSGDQSNLLVSDNRAEEWAALDDAGREELSIRAWGRDGQVRLRRRRLAFFGSP